MMIVSALIDLSSFADWISKPQAYNWITLVAALAATSTAIFTGYSAFVLWSGRRKRVDVEWKVEFHQEGLRVFVFIKNGLDTTIDGDRAIVRGPVESVKSRQEKHESFPSNVAPLFRYDAPSGGVTEFTIIVKPNATALRAKATSWLARPRFWVTVIAWKALHWRVSSGVKFSVVLFFVRRSSKIRPIRLTHTIRIHPPQAIKMAETIEKNAAKT